MAEGWRTNVLMSRSGDFLFYSFSNGYTFYTLMDKNGNIVKSEEISLTVECFVKAMLKAGYMKAADWPAKS